LDIAIGGNKLEANFGLLPKYLGEPHRAIITL
jgi:hypothetical protein